MLSPVRTNNAVASYLYFITIAIYGLPALYKMLPQPLGPARHQGMGGDSIAIIVGTVFLLLSLYIGLGLGIRAGKTWAKGLFFLFLAALLLSFFRHPLALVHKDFWSWIRTWFPVVVQLATAYFLLQDSFIRRPASETPRQK